MPRNEPLVKNVCSNSEGSVTSEIEINLQLILKQIITVAIASPTINFDYFISAINYQVFNKEFTEKGSIEAHFFAVTCVKSQLASNFISKHIFIKALYMHVSKLK